MQKDVQVTVDAMLRTPNTMAAARRVPSHVYQGEYIDVSPHSYIALPADAMHLEAAGLCK